MSARPISEASTATPLRRWWGVGASYAAQGWGYATAVTALPGLKDRVGMDDSTVSIVILAGCITAAGGSVIAERIAVRRGSHLALLFGLTVQVLGLPLVALSTSVPMLIASFALYGVGLGAVDAGSAMQGVQVQQRAGRPVLSGLFACYTAAAIAAALVMSGAALLGAATGAVVALVVAAIAIGLVVLTARSALVPAREVADQSSSDPLPRRGIWLFGSMILAAFVVDSAVSTWSSVLLHDSLASGAVIAPLGYAAYQGAILLTRLVGDRVVAARSRATLLIPAVTVAVVSLAVLAVIGSPWLAIVAFALVGVGVGALVPLTFSAAGELAPERTHEVIARINLFNYAGALLGAVTLGLLSEWPGLGPAFLVPAVLLVPALLLARRFNHPQA